MVWCGMRVRCVVLWIECLSFSLLCLWIFLWRMMRLLLFCLWKRCNLCLRLIIWRGISFGNWVLRFVWLLLSGFWRWSMFFLWDLFFFYDLLMWLVFELVYLVLDIGGDDWLSCCLGVKNLCMDYVFSEELCFIVVMCCVGLFFL